MGQFDAVPIEVRLQRVREGSRRKRDLVAVAAYEAEQLGQVLDTVAAQDAWSRVVGRLRGAVPDSTFRIWLAPLELVGERDGKLVFTAPRGIRTWVERRYTGLIEQALRGTGIEGVEFL